jgi:hypothetical protein
MKFNPIQKPTLTKITSSTSFKKQQQITTTSTIKRSSFLEAIYEAFENKEVALFFFIVFFIGVSSGIIENFAYVRMSEIAGKHKNVIGLSRLLSSLAGGPMFWLSGQILQCLGINRVLTLTLTSYFLRFCTYAYMTNPVLNNCYLNKYTVYL